MAVNSDDSLFLGLIYQYGPNDDDFYATILKSADNGNSWTDTKLNLFPPVIMSLTMILNGYIFAGTDDGVMRSTDNGDNWTKLKTGLGYYTERYVRCTVINPNDNIFIGTIGGAFSSTNNGDNWTTISKGIANTEVRALAFGLNNKLFAAAGGNSPGISVSSDNGENWIKIYDRGVNILKTNSEGYVF